MWRLTNVASMLDLIMWMILRISHLKATFEKIFEAMGQNQHYRMMIDSIKYKIVWRNVSNGFKGNK